MHICNVRSQVFFPGVWVCLRDFYFYFFGSLEREPSLWENTWPWEILRTWESFPGIPLGNQDLWGGEKESTFDTGRRVETGTYHWEGRKPFIQTFEISFNDRLIISQLVVPASLFCTLKLLGLHSDAINYTPAAIIPIKIVPARDPKQRGRNLKRSCIIMLVRMLMLLIMLKKILMMMMMMMMMMRMRGRLWCGCWGGGGGGRRRWWCWGGWCWGGRPIPRPGSTLCASLRSPNLHGHFTRAIVCGNWQGKCRTPSPRHPLCGSLRSRNACQKKHFVQKFAVKMPDASPAASVLCEPAQSKCTWTCHRRHFVWKLTENAKRPGYHLDWTPDLNTYRKNPSVWTRCNVGSWGIIPKSGLWFSWLLEKLKLPAASLPAWP